MDQTFFQCATGKDVKASRSSFFGVAQHGLDSGELSAEHGGDHVELGVDVLGVGLGEDRADRGGEHVGVALGDTGEDVAQEVDAAALPRGAGEHRPDRGLESFVGVGDHQLDPVQAAGLERAQERGPERSVLTVADVEPQDFPVAVGTDRGGDHDRLGDHPPVHPGLAVGGVEEHVGVGVGLQGPAAERGDFLVEVGTDPRHLTL